MERPSTEISHSQLFYHWSHVGLKYGSLRYFLCKWSAVLQRKFHKRRLSASQMYCSFPLHKAGGNSLADSFQLFLFSVALKNSLQLFLLALQKGYELLRWVFQCQIFEAADEEGTSCCSSFVLGVPIKGLWVSFCSCIWIKQPWLRVTQRRKLWCISNQSSF